MPVKTPKDMSKQPQELCETKGYVWDVQNAKCNTTTRVGITGCGSVFGCCLGTTVPQKDRIGLHCPPECKSGKHWDVKLGKCVEPPPTGCDYSRFGCCPDGITAAGDLSKTECKTPEARCGAIGDTWDPTNNKCRLTGKTSCKVCESAKRCFAADQGCTKSGRRVWTGAFAFCETQDADDCAGCFPTSPCTGGGSDAPACCSDLTASCMACKKGLTVAAFCAKTTQNFDGCKTATTTSAPACCSDLTASCMACKKGLTVAALCKTVPTGEAVKGC